MKKMLLSVCLLLCGWQVSAQDVITKTNAEELKAKIVTISDDQIEYKKWENLDGPTYTISPKEVFTIKYQNGTKDIFTTLKSQADSYAAAPGQQRSQYLGNSDFRSRNAGYTPSRYDYPRYEGQIAFAYGLGVGQISKLICTDRVVFETVHGVRISPYAFVGAGIGLNYFYTKYQVTDGYLQDEISGFCILPIFINAKGYYPLSDKFALYLSLDLGAATSLSKYVKGTEFYTAVGPGFTIGKKNCQPRGDFSIRFQHMGAGMNAMLFRIGIGF